MMGERQGRQDRLFYEFCLDDVVPSDDLQHPRPDLDTHQFPKELSKGRVETLLKLRTCTSASFRPSIDHPARRAPLEPLACRPRIRAAPRRHAFAWKNQGDRDLWADRHPESRRTLAWPSKNRKHRPATEALSSTPVRSLSRSPSDFMGGAGTPYRLPPDCVSPNPAARIADHRINRIDERTPGHSAQH